MAEHGEYPGHSVSVAPLPRMYSSDLLPHLRLLLSILADIDFKYEEGCARIRRRIKNLNLRIRLLERCRQRHRQRREPYLQQLALLQEHIRQACQ
jgi:hypothetical protein